MCIERCPHGSGGSGLFGGCLPHDLDIDVQRLKLLKANHLSQRYALEDQIIKVLPQKIASFEQRIEGYTADMNRLKENTHPNADGFSPMEVEGTVYTDGVYTELNQLGGNINRMLGQLQIQAEQIEENRKQLLHQNVRQERAEKMRKDMLANISHELKTPLAVISNQAEMLGYVKENQEYYIASIQEEATKMSDMVGKILDSSAVEYQMQNMVQKNLDMKEVIGYMAMKYEGLAKKKKLHLETFLSEDCFVYGDREYIEQAVNNYMMNALEHTDFGGDIRITLKKQGESVRVGVYNDGRRIPQEELGNISKILTVCLR